MQNTDTLSLTEPKARGQRLQSLRVLCGTTVAEFCNSQDISLNKGSVYNWESPQLQGGISKLGARKVIARAEELGIICSYEWIMYGIGLPPIYAGGQVQRELKKEESDFLEAISALCSNHRILQYTVPDHAMSPEYLPGDIVIGFKQNKAADAIGKNCIIIAQDHSILVRRLDKSEKHQRFTLRPLNALEDEFKTIYDTQIKLAAPILMRWRRGCF